MSKTIDERVVSMQFDNRNFEANARTSMSTLDKLKDKLNFKAAAKGLDNLDAAVKGMNLSPIGQAADKVGLRFSAMYTVADQTFRNIVNSAEAMAKRLVSAFTIDPVKTGLSEYETKINAIQVIKSNTRGKNTMDDITSALDELNTYADKTIYNFAQMTNNVGKFVAQGLDAHQAAKAVQGMANLAAASGASAEDMARATYQMSQALGGTIRKIDWNSLRNANMATVDLKNTLMDLAKVNGIDIDGMIAKKGTFEDTLEEGWLSGSLFTEAMNIYSGVYDEMELKAKGFTDAQIENFMGLAEEAASAATEVKTFSQLMDVLKETAQSGWTQTWELLIGDFDTAKKSLTKLQVYFSTIIDRMSDARNFLLKGALYFTEPWSKIMAKLEGAGLGKVKEMVETVGDFTDKLEYFQDVVNDVWRGDYKNADTGRYDLLKAAGYDSRVVQDLVNKGYGYKITVEDIEASHKKFGIVMEQTTKETEKMVSAMENLTDEQLKKAGLTEDEIRLYRDVQKEAERTGKSMDEIVDAMSKTSGRDLLIESLKNAWTGLTNILKAAKTAWGEIFEPISIVRLYGIIESINKFSKHLTVSVKSADRFKRIFKGVFAILDVVTTLLGGGFKIAFKAAAALCKVFGVDILEVIALVGDAAVRFRDWIDSLLDFEKIFSSIGDLFIKAANGIQEWKKGLKETDNVPKYIADSIVNGLSNAGSWIWGAMKNFGTTLLEGLLQVFNVDMTASEFVGAAKNIILGLIKGLRENIPIVLDVIGDVGTYLIEKFCEVLGIHSPSTKAIEIGKNVILGLAKGMKDAVVMVYDLVITIGTKITEFLKDLDLETALVTGFGITGFVALFKTLSIIKDFSTPFRELGNMFNTLGDAIKDYKNAKIASLRTDTIQKLAISIGIIVAALFVISLIEKRGNLWESVGALAAIVGIVAALAAVVILLDKNVNRLDSEGKGLRDSMKIVTKLVGSIFLMVVALAILSKIAEGGQLWESVGALAVVSAVIVALVAVILLMGKIQTIGDMTNMVSVGSMLLAMASAMLIMVLVIKLASMLDIQSVLKGLTVVSVITLLFMGVIAVSQFAGEHAAKAGAMMLLMSIAILILVGVIKLISMLSAEEITKGIFVIGLIEILFVAMVAVSKFAGANAAKAGVMMLSMSVAILIAVYVIKLIASIKPGDIALGLFVMSGIATIFAAIIAVSTLAGKDAGKVGVMLLAMSAAMLVMVGCMFILSLIKPDGLARAEAAIVILMGCFAGIIAVTKIAKNSKQLHTTLLYMAIIIALLVGSIIGLSFIKPERLAGATAAIAIVIGCFAGLMALTKVTKNTKDTMRTLWTITGVMALLAGVILLLSLMEPERLTGAAAAIAIVVGCLAGLMMLTKVVKSTKSMKSTLLMLTGVIALLAGIVIILSALTNGDNALKSCLALSALMISLGGVLVICSLLGNKSKSAGPGIAALTAMVIPLMAFIAVLHFMPEIPSHVAEGMKVVLIVMGVMTLMLAPLILLGATGWIAFIGILALTAMAAVLLGFIAILKFMPKIPEHVSKDLDLVYQVMIMMTALLIPLTIIGATHWVVFIGVLALTAMTIPLMAFIAILRFMPKMPEHVPKNLDLVLQVMILMTTLLVPLTVIGLLGPFALAGIVLLTAMIIPLTVFCVALALFPDISDSIGTVTILTSLLMSLTGILMLLSTLSPSVIIGVIALEALSALILAFGVVATAVGALVTKIPDFEKFLDTGIPILVKMAEGLGLMIAKFISVITDEIAESLPKLGQALSDFMANATYFIMMSKMVDESVVKGVGYLAAAVIALVAVDFIDAISSFLQGGDSFASLGTELSNFMINAMPFIMLAGTIKEDMLTGVKTLANILMTLTAADLLDNLGSMGIGGLFGSLFAGDVEQKSPLVSFAEQLPAVGTGIQKFITNLGEINGKKMRSVNAACEALTCIANAAKDLPNEGGLIGKLFGDNSLGTFADYLGATGQGIHDFIVNLCGENGFDDAQLNVVKIGCEALTCISNAAKDLPNSGGWISKIVGDNKLSDFADQLKGTGQGIHDFIIALYGESGFGEDQLKVVKLGCEALTLLSNVAKELPNDGGWAGKIFGENSIASFGEQLPKFGANLRSFVDNLFGESGFGEDQLKTVEFASKAISLLGASADAVPSSGGWLQQVFGENNVAAFADDLPDLAANLRDFVDELGVFDNQTVATVNATARVIAAIASMMTADMLDNSWFGKLIKGETSLANIGEELPPFANSIKDFVANLGTFGEKKLATVNSAINVIKQIAALARVDLKKAVEHIADFGVELETFGSKLAGFATNVSAVSADTLDTAQKNVNAVIQVATAVSKERGANIAQFANNLEKIAGKAMDNFVNAFTGDASTEKILSTVSTMVGKFTSGLGSDENIQAFKALGEDFGDGLIMGIQAKEQEVYDAGYNLGLQAVLGEKAGQQSNSPSKLTVKAGKWLGEGLVVGMEKMTNAVYGTGHTLGETATNSISNAVNRISAALENDINAQPTIAPVLDLTNVTSGVNAINGMFAGRRTLSIDTRSVGVAAASMSNRQNGMDTSDVVSSIKALRKDLANMPRESININGITYNDDSNITDAVRTIVRAVRVEGRV